MNKTLSWPWRKLNSLLSAQHSQRNTPSASVGLGRPKHLFPQRSLYPMHCGSCVGSPHKPSLPSTSTSHPNTFSLPFLWDYLDSLLASQYLWVEVLF